MHQFVTLSQFVTTFLYFHPLMNRIPEYPEYPEYPELVRIRIDMNCRYKF